MQHYIFGMFLVNEHSYFMIVLDLLEITNQIYIPLKNFFFNIEL